MMVVSPDDGWDRVEVARQGDTVEVAQANYGRTGCFLQVTGKANLDHLIAALLQARKEMP
jgi:hypothetical protein